MCSHSEQTGRHPKHVRWHQSTTEKGRRGREGERDESREKKQAAILPWKTSSVLSPGLAGWCQQGRFLCTEHRDTVHIFDGINLMYYLSPTWIISIELKLTSWKPIRIFYCFSGDAKFLPHAQLIRTWSLAQQGWLCTHMLWEPFQHFLPEAQRSCACVSNLRLRLFMTFKEPAAVLILAPLPSADWLLTPSLIFQPYLYSLYLRVCL